ncbi:MAG: hypothetical protein WC260_01570 [Candidatus Pacearchaeota archaeon]
MIKSKYLIITIVILVLSLGMVCNTNNMLKRNIQRQNSNIEAINDTINIYRTQNDLLVSEKMAISSTNKELKILNSDLYNEKKNLEKELNIISNAYQRLRMQGIVNTKYDTVIIDKDILDSNTNRFTLKSEQKDSIVTTFVTASLDVLCFMDSSDIINSDIESTFKVDGLKVNIITGYRRKGLFRRDEQYIISVTTNDERFIINDIDSWTKHDEKSRPYINMRPGFLVGGIYNPFTNDVSLGIGVGIIFSMGR